MESLQFKQRFLSEIRQTFDYGGLNCSFTERELSDFHNYLEKGFPYNEPGRVKKGANCLGKQLNANVWVLNESTQIDENGTLIPLENSQFVWQPIGGPCIETMYAKSSTRIDIKSIITTPLSTLPLGKLLDIMTSTFKHNFIPGK